MRGEIGAAGAATHSESIMQEEHRCSGGLAALHRQQRLVASPRARIEGPVHEQLSPALYRALRRHEGEGDVGDAEPEARRRERGEHARAHVRRR